MASPEHWLALDEAALDHVEEHGGPGLLWFYEADTPWVVVGYGQDIAREVHLDACKADAIPIYRRCSGGGTVVQGPGCLSYGLVLPLDAHPDLASITGANRWIMGRQRNAVAPLLPGIVSVEGHTDLARDGRKFSGNAQRRRRQSLLFHGTFLCTFDLAGISRWLAFPSAQPGYRASRDHASFVCNLGLSTTAVAAAIRDEWKELESTLPPSVHARIPGWISSRYGDRAWHERRA